MHIIFVMDFLWCNQSFFIFRKSLHQITSFFPEKIVPTRQKFKVLNESCVFIYVPVKRMIHELIMAMPAREKLVTAAGQKLTVPLVVFAAIDQFLRVPVRRKRARNLSYIA